MLTYYQTFKDKNNLIYSLDMIRLNFTFKNIHCLDAYINKINKLQLSKNFEINQYLNQKGIGYRYLYNFKIIDSTYECSFTIGHQLNCASDKQLDGFFEFNPNKCFASVNFIEFFDYFCDLLYSMTLIRYDVAIDIPFKREFVKLIRNNRSNYQYLTDFDKKGTILARSVTEYQGRRNHNKFTKLYDKTKESNLDYDLTRLEFTFDKKECTFNGLAKINITCLDNNQDYSHLNDTNLVLIDLLRNCNEEDFNFYLKRLPLFMRKKIEPFLYDTTLAIDISTIISIKNLALAFEI